MWKRACDKVACVLYVANLAHDKDSAGVCGMVGRACDKVLCDKGKGAEEAEAAEAGYKIKNKNPTQRRGDYVIHPVAGRIL